MQTQTATKQRPAGLQAALAIVGSEGYDVAKSLWNDEMTVQERRIFLIASRCPMRFDKRAWQQLGEEWQREIRASMLRFYRRFSPMLAQLERQEG